jgi:hypothetical protein
MMSVWRRKVIECFPELKKEFEQPDISIYTVFSELLSSVIEAHKKNDIIMLQKIYDFAEWCFRQSEKELWNAAGVCFYEHLGDNQQTLKAMPNWINKNLYTNIRGLLELRLSDKDLMNLDKNYFGKPTN